MANHPPSSADPEQIRNAQDMWNNVTQAAKWSVLGIVLIMAGLGAIFIDW
ncbi:MAG: hypothetical protein WBK77_04360 [Alphaproteobacteria bacterium]